MKVSEYLASTPNMSDGREPHTKQQTPYNIKRVCAAHKNSERQVHLHTLPSEVLADLGGGRDALVDARLDLRLATHPREVRRGTEDSEGGVGADGQAHPEEASPGIV